MDQSVRLFSHAVNPGIWQQLEPLNQGSEKVSKGRVTPYVLMLALLLFPHVQN